MKSRLFNNFKLSEIFQAANIISLLRIPLAVLMIIFYENKILFLSLFVAAMVSDALDGFVARRTKATAFGAFLDPLCDKVFFVLIVVFLFFNLRLELWQVLVFLSRDAFVSFIMLLLLLYPERQKFKNQIRSRWPGKITTITQFATLIWLFLGFGHIDYFIILVGIASLSAVIDYSFFIIEELRKR